jgi:ERF superfamily
MQRSSPSIGTLASALAKAQGELVNPEKSLVAIIRGEGPTGTERTFRYAPLSSGLEIVRKVLGQHEIATVQTTSIDQAAGIINLTTMLAHASGEWIASDWPVCAISETATPHRMGAALTYARRYALFTLVGIAGEDDLDAPDLTTPMNGSSGSRELHLTGNGQPTDGHDTSAQQAMLRQRAGIHQPSIKMTLGPEASASLRDQLIAEISDLKTGDNAVLWAHRNLAEKNKLTAADARRVEEHFEAKLENLPAGLTEELQAVNNAAQAPLKEGEAKPNSRRRSNMIDKGLLTFPEPRRIRDRDHVKYVASQPCLICTRQPSDAHHLRFVQSRAFGRKASDEFTVPMCRGHHREVHRSGDEAAWWRKSGIDPTLTARTLWLETHSLTGSNSAETPEL